ncbi:MAG TPA: hypothetical protein PLX89_18105 [Verrucomicrobiota bacterium]|nr:hypothetical protein [Verrucomicrobiota bacterium]
MPKPTAKKKSGAISAKAKPAASSPAAAAATPLNAASPAPVTASTVQPGDQNATGWSADEVLDQINLDFANGQQSLFFGNNGTLYYRQLSV